MRGNLAFALLPCFFEFFHYFDQFTVVGELWVNVFQVVSLFTDDGAYIAKYVFDLPT